MYEKHWANDFKNLCFEHLIENFSWIKSVKMITSPLALPITEAYQILTKEEISEDDPKILDFNKFVIDFFEVSKQRASIIPCWRHDELILLVFKQTTF